MLQYMGTPGPRSVSGWVGESVGKHVGDFWDSIGNVNEINTQLKKKELSQSICGHFQSLNITNAYSLIFMVFKGTIYHVPKLRKQGI